MKTYVVQTIARRINIRVVLWGLAIVTDWERDEWNEELLIAMFPFSISNQGMLANVPEYPYLTRHLWRNWWWIGKGARKTLPRIAKMYKGLGLVQIPREEYNALDATNEYVRSTR